MDNFEVPQEEFEVPHNEEEFEDDDWEGDEFEDELDLDGEDELSTDDGYNSDEDSDVEYIIVEVEMGEEESEDEGIAENFGVYHHWATNEKASLDPAVSLGMQQIIDVGNKTFIHHTVPFNKSFWDVAKRRHEQNPPENIKWFLECANGV